MEDMTRDLALDYNIEGAFAQQVDSPVLSGRIWRYEIAGGITAMGHDYRCLAEVRMTETPRNALLAIVQLDGQASMTLAGDEVVMPPCSRTLVNLTGDALCTGHVHESARSRAVGFMILRDEVADSPDPAFARLMAFDTGPVRRLPADGQLLAIAESALDHDHAGLMERLHVESRMLALVLRMAERMAQEAGVASRLALTVRDELELRLSDPLTI